MPDKLREKYYDLYINEKITEYRNNHPEASTMDDIQIFVALNIHFRGTDARKHLTDFLAFCVKKELEKRVYAAQMTTVKNFREANPSYSKRVTDDEIIASLPIPPIELMLFENEIKKELLQMIKEEIESLEKENAEDRELQKEANNGRTVYRELGTDISNTNRNIYERQVAASILEDDITSRGL